jgi:AraC-like DNA-binding protein/mannose-6-phosphate isomerase-like protein (cupin superfamily)
MKQQAGSNLSQRPYNIVVASNTHFPSHIHNVYEVFCVKKGTATAQINGVDYQLAEGDGLVVFPLQYHSYTVDDSSRIEIYVFSPHFVPEFEEQTAGKHPADAKFPASNLPALPEDTSNILVTKSFFYRLCAQILNQVRMEGIHTGKTLSVLDELFLFVDRNYDKSCTLRDAAESLKYDYTYLSKLFRQRTGMGFNSYVNRFRIGRATYLLFSGDRSIGEVALEVGYNAIRTFNWEFKKIMGTTPEQYRSKIH